MHSKQLICISLFTVYHSKHILSCARHKRTLFTAYCREWFLQENNLFFYKLYFCSHVFLVTELRQVSELMTSCSSPLTKTAGYIYSSQFWNPAWFQSHVVHYSVPQCNPLVWIYDGESGGRKSVLELFMTRSSWGEIYFVYCCFLYRLLCIEKILKTRAPLSHRKHCSLNASWLVLILIPWLCDVTLQFSSVVVSGAGSGMCELTSQRRVGIWEGEPHRDPPLKFLSEEKDFYWLTFFFYT